jgi:hypothetical protein
LRKFKVNKRKSDSLPVFKIPYGNSSIEVPYPENPQEYKCDACGRSVSRHQIDTTILDHWRLAYRTKTLAKEPWKALENLNELCATDHKLRLALKSLLNPREEELWTVTQVGLLMPEEMKRKMDRVARSWLIARKTDKSKRTDMRSFIQR